MRLLFERGIAKWRRDGLLSLLLRVLQKISTAIYFSFRRFSLRFRIVTDDREFPVSTLTFPSPIALHNRAVDIVICVHNALPDIRLCLESILQNTTEPYSLLLIDDGSGEETKNYLENFAGSHSVKRIRNETPHGYTRAANQGLRAATAGYVVLLNSDTVVPPGWLEGLMDSLLSADNIGAVSPLSNTASWQSIPDIEAEGEWASNPLPDGLSLEEFAAGIERSAARLYPEMPFLNGFCLLLRREAVQQTGFFNEDLFGEGYGEENDYCIRLREQGWKLVLADNVYIRHAQGSSYSESRRKRLSEQANRTLIRTHGARIVEEGVQYCRGDRVLEGIRARARILPEQERWINSGRERFSGKRVLFLLPVTNPGGGGNIVLLKAKLMRRMGVDAEVFNLLQNRETFLRHYRSREVPVRFGGMDEALEAAAHCDAVIATAFHSVPMLKRLADALPQVRRGYLIQDFEPYFFSPQSMVYQEAWRSYALVPDVVRMANSEWTRREVMLQAGGTCELAGPCFDVHLFRPRPRTDRSWPDRPLRICAMIRPENEYRNPVFTMRVLRRIAKRFGPEVEIVLFGTDMNGIATLPDAVDFPWRLAGRMSTEEMAWFFNEMDIFADFSTHQALGIAAQEAMACGVAVIVPRNGGADSYAADGHNAIIADTGSEQECFEALEVLARNADLRNQIQRQALFDVCLGYPEKPACRMLEFLFSPGAKGGENGIV